MQPLPPAHQDYLLLKLIADDILKRAGGEPAFRAFVTEMLRAKIDSVINTVQTNRRSLKEVEKTEKTYIGTLVEIAFRTRLKLPRSKKDLLIAGHTVDVKTTVRGNWMIAKDCIGIPCVLVAADEIRAQCSVGLIVARSEYMTQKGNQDKKVSISAAGRAHIWWLLKDVPYPANFWRRVDDAVVDRIFAPKSGNGRMITLFKALPGRVIPRNVIEAVAGGKDPTRRVRFDKSKKNGTRDQLAAAGFVVLSGDYDSLLITALGLPHVGGSEFISFQLRDEHDRQVARGNGYPGV